jgi:hypothetical protein
MKFFGLTLVFVIVSSIIHAQHTHTKEMGMKGKVKKITCIYYAEGIFTNNAWSPKDSSRFTYKTVNYYNINQNLDSVYTYVNHSGKEKLTTRKGYSYPKNSEISGWEYDHMDDISYNITLNWIDKSTYIENAADPSGLNRMRSKVYLDDKFHIIKREDELFRDGELFDHSITETKFNPDNTEHAISVTENKVSNLEYSLDEYTDQRDSHGNAIKKTYKNGINSFRSIRYYIIEYYD